MTSQPVGAYRTGSPSATQATITLAAEFTFRVAGGAMTRTGGDGPRSPGRVKSWPSGHRTGTP
jgi:hypothetical protein